MKVKRNNQIDKIFYKYIQNQNKPSDDVISKAKFLIKHSQNELLEEHDLVSPCTTSNDNPKPKFTFSFFLKVLSPLSLTAILVLTLSLFLPNIASINKNGSDNLETLNLNEVHDMNLIYKEELPFIPFVRKETVNEYHQYYLDSYSNDPILYYVNYDSSYDEDTDLYIENNKECKFEDFNEFKTCKDVISSNNMDFLYKIGNYFTFVLFEHNDLTYNLKIELFNKNTIRSYLNTIASSFNKAHV